MRYNCVCWRSPGDSRRGEVRVMSSVVRSPAKARKKKRADGCRWWLMATQMSTWTQRPEIAKIGTDFKRKGVFVFGRSLLARSWHMPKSLWELRWKRRWRPEHADFCDSITTSFWLTILCCSKVRQNRPRRMQKLKRKQSNCSKRLLRRCWTTTGAVFRCGFLGARLLDDLPDMDGWKRVHSP